MEETDAVTEAIEQLQQEGLRRFGPYPAYRNSGVEWLGKIPAHWEVNRLRSTVSGCQNGVWGDEADGVHDMICVRVADFDRVQFRVLLEESTVRSIEPRVAQNRQLARGDLLLEKSGGGEQQPVGALVIYDHDESAVCSNFIARVQVTDGYDSRFLTYLHAALYSARINTRSIKQSTGIQNLDSASYLNEVVGLPELTEQRAIATFLDRETRKIDGLMTRKERLVELLQEKRTALITRAVTRGLDPNVPMKDSGVEWLGEIPAHWRTVRVMDHTAVINGYPFDSALFTLGEGMPLVRIRDLGSVETEVQYAGEPVEAARIRTGDILIGMDGEFNVGRWKGEDALLNQRMCCLRPLESINGQFLLYSVPFPLKIINYLTYSTTVKHLSSFDVKKVALAYPPKHEQEEIAAVLDRETAKIDALIAKVRDASDHLKEFRTALISAAVTGKIDVREAVR